MTAAAAPPRADYGVDAPGVVRNLFLAAGAGLIVILLLLTGVIPSFIAWRPVSGLEVRVGLRGLGLGLTCGFGFTGCAMLWSSRIGKRRRRERLLDAIPWNGRERVLDVGCGRGLMLLGAAKRLSGGQATGVDIWREEDLSGNRPEATMANAVAEGVADRVRLETADMRQLPFADGKFDRVLSCAAIHNLAQAADRAQAIQEISRVLRPGGYALIDDVRHVGEYQEMFRRAGYPQARRLDNRAVSLGWALLTFGTLRPGTLLLRKPA